MIDFNESNCLGLSAINNQKTVGLDYEKLTPNVGF